MPKASKPSKPKAPKPKAPKVRTMKAPLAPKLKVSSIPTVQGVERARMSVAKREYSRAQATPSVYNLGRNAKRHVKKVYV